MYLLIRLFVILILCLNSLFEYVVFISCNQLKISVLSMKRSGRENPILNRTEHTPRRKLSFRCNPKSRRDDAVSNIAQNAFPSTNTAAITANAE